MRVVVMVMGFLPGALRPNMVQRLALKPKWFLAFTSRRVEKGRECE